MNGWKTADEHALEIKTFDAAAPTVDRCLTPVRTGGMRVLVIEDEEATSFLMRKMLEKEFSATVEVAADWVGAKESLLADTFDIVTLDLMLPDGNGLELLSEIKAMDSHLPVVIVTGEGNEQACLAAFQRGIAGYVIKDGQMLSRLIEVVGNAAAAAALESSKRARVGREKYYRSLIDQSLDVILVVTPAGTITFASPVAGVFFGCDAADLVDRNIFDFLREEDSGRLLEELSNLLVEPGSVGSVQLQVRRSDGGFRDIEALGKAFARESDEPYVVINGRDITERKRMERSLAELNECFLSMGASTRGNIDMIVARGLHILQGVLMVYTRGRRGERQSCVSCAAHPDHFLGFGYSEAFLGNPIECHEAPLPIEDISGFPGGNGIIAGARKAELESVLVYPVTIDGEMTGRLYLFYDKRVKISKERIEIMGMLTRALVIEEERLAHEQDLKDFIAIASHELRHPITVIKGYAMTLEKHNSELSKEHRAQILSNINKGADRLTSLVTELMDTSNIDRGLFEVFRREANIETLINRAVGQMHTRGVKHEIDVHVEKGLGSRFVDPVKLMIAMVHMIENAVNYSPAGTGIRVIACPDGAGLKVSVLDRGPGVPLAERSQIFNRFYRADDVEHHSVPGIGLGLYIAKNIIEGHGGEIRYEPREGGGSIFSFTLP